MFIEQSAARYAQLRYFCEIGHFLQDLLAFIRYAFFQYEPFDLSANIFEVLFRDWNVAESKYVIDGGCYHSDISDVRVTRPVRLPIDGFHIDINDYNIANVITDKVFV
jgi:hypothetical protein